MKILLIGEVYSDNLGDPLLCESVERLIQDKYPCSEIVRFDMSGRISFQARYTKYKSPLDLAGKIDIFTLYFSLIRDRNLYRAFAKDRSRYISMWCSLCNVMRKQHFDLAIFAGGSLFMDYFAGIINLIVAQLAKKRINTIFHACGMSSLGDTGRYLLEEAFNRDNITCISLRDSYEHFLSLFSTRAPVIETYDTALNCSLLYTPADEKIAQYGIGLKFGDEYFEEQVSLIREMRMSTLQWKVFTNGDVNDVYTEKNVLLRAGICEKELEFYLTERPKTIMELVNSVTQFERIISFRMHSQIIAASFGIPCYGISWDNKISEFFSKLGFPQNESVHVKSLLEMQTALQGCCPEMRRNALQQAEISKNHLFEEIEAAIGGEK